MAAILCALGLGAVAAAPAAAAETVVSLTFKDSLISQHAARQTLAEHGINGTFYVNSGLIANRADDVQNRMSWRQINELAADGNEIGGGGLSRQVLATLDDAQLEAEICDDRAELARRGYAPVSFGYPFGGDGTATVAAKVEQCGYASARGSNGIGGAGQPAAESIPPQDPFNTRVRAVGASHTPATVQGWITSAEAGGGGWLQLVIHSVCDDPGCSITPANLDALLDWLEDREDQGTQTRTVREVMTGTTQPEPPPFLETTVSLNFDDGLDEHYDIARPVLNANGVAGTFYVNSGRVAEDDRFLVWSQVEDLADEGHEIGGHGKDHDNLIDLDEDELEEQICDDRDDLIDDGNLSASQQPVSFAYPRGFHDQATKDMVEQCGYSSARWTEGLKWYTRHNRCQLLSCPFDEQIHPQDPYKVRTVGSFGQVDNDIERFKQTVRNVEDSGGGWLPLLFHEICPGPSPTESGCPDESSSTTPELFTEFVEWLADREAINGTEVKTMEEVITGPAEPRDPVDTTDPVSQVACDGGACAPGVSPDPVSVTLSATDAGGSGVKEIRYTTDGSLPTGSSPVYGGPIAVGQTSTIRWRASDNHGNVEQLRSQLVEVAGDDSTAPVSSIACDGAPCGAGFHGEPVSVTLAATDAGGSGVKEIRYTTDGSDPELASPLYVGPIEVDATTTIRFRAEDHAGNVEAPAAQQTVLVDLDAPVSEAVCNGLACQGLYTDGPVVVSLAAADEGGSGLSGIRFTTDGSEPDGLDELYTDPIFLVESTTIRYRAEDSAGNVESPAHELNVQIVPDPALPRAEDPADPPASKTKKCAKRKQPKGTKRAASKRRAKACKRKKGKKRKKKKGKSQRP